MNLHQFSRFKCSVTALSSLDNDFILIGLLKQCVQSRGILGVLKIERYEHMGILSEHARRESNYSSSAPLLF